jgi:hypothetical protein
VGAAEPEMADGVSGVKTAGLVEEVVFGGHRRKGICRFSCTSGVRT